MSKIQILKAIHNTVILSINIAKLFMMSKIQILKAIHNANSTIGTISLAVYDVKDTNFESNSQHIRMTFQPSAAVYDVKDTNFESNSQPGSHSKTGQVCCL